MSQVQNKHPTLVPGLAIVQVGGRDDSNVYIRMKIRAAAEIGIEAQHVKLPRTITQNELLAKVRCIVYSLRYLVVIFSIQKKNEKNMSSLKKFRFLIVGRTEQ